MLQTDERSEFNQKIPIFYFDMLAIQILKSSVEVIKNDATVILCPKFHILNHFGQWTCYCKMNLVQWNGKFKNFSRFRLHVGYKSPWFLLSVTEVERVWTAMK